MLKPYGEWRTKHSLDGLTGRGGRVGCLRRRQMFYPVARSLLTRPPEARCQPIASYYEVTFSQHNFTSV